MISKEIKAGAENSADEFRDNTPVPEPFIKKGHLVQQLQNDINSVWSVTVQYSKY